MYFPINRQLLGKVIRSLRKKAGITQSGLADQIGVTKNFINLLETNKRGANLETLEKIAKAFNVPTVALFAAATPVSQAARSKWAVAIRQFQKLVEDHPQKR